MGRHLFQKSPLCVIYILAYLYIYRPLDLYIVHPIYISTQVFVNMYFYIIYISLDLHISPSVDDYSLSWCKFSVPCVYLLIST